MRNIRKSDYDTAFAKFPILKILNDCLPSFLVMKLAGKYGGRKVSIPKKFKNNYTISKLIGYENSKIIIGAFGGRSLYIPAVSSIKREILAAQVSSRKQS